MNNNKTSNFTNYSKYYELLYSDKNYELEVDYILLLLNELNISKGCILEFGSGTGIHGNLLAKRNFTIHGVERSSEMVKRSVISNGFTCEQGDICTVNLNRSFDVVLSLFHVISYQTTNDNLLAVLNNANSHLDLGGYFIFDFWYSPAVYLNKPSTRIKRVNNDQYNLVRISEPESFHNENRIDINYTIYSHDILTNNYEFIKETHQMRHFSIPEINLFAGISGFKVVNIEEFLTRNIASNKTWSVCVVLQKIK